MDKKFDTTYEVCPHCGEDKLKPTWYFSFCGENCKKMLIFATKKEVNEEAKHKTKFTNRRQHFSPKSVCLHTSTSNGRWTDCSTKKASTHQGYTNPVSRPYQRRTKTVPTPLP